MINELYVFSPGSYVVADEWNANFKAIDTSNKDCAAAVADGNDKIAFPDSDLTQLFTQVAARPNSFQIPGNNVVIAPQCEYYKALPNGQDLNIQIPAGFNSEARVAVSIGDDRTLLPFSVSYGGNLKISSGDGNIFNAGKYFILINEIAGNATVKLIWTGE